MIKAERIHRDNNRPSWLARCREMLAPRNLIVFIPILVSLIFGAMYTFEQQVSYENQQQIRVVKGQNQQLKDDPPSKEVLPTAESSKTLTTPPSTIDPTNSSETTAPSNMPANSSSSTTLVPLPVSVCDTVAKTLAYTTEQTALTAENTYHTSQLVLALLGGNQAAEDARHSAAIQQIQDTYATSLADAHCQL